MSRVPKYLVFHDCSGDSTWHAEVDKNTSISSVVSVNNMGIWTINVAEIRLVFLASILRILMLLLAEIGIINPVPARLPPERTGVRSKEGTDETHGHPSWSHPSPLIAWDGWVARRSSVFASLPPSGPAFGLGEQGFTRSCSSQSRTDSVLTIVRSLGNIP